MPTTARCPVTHGLPALPDPLRDADFLRQMEHLLPWPALANLAGQSLSRARSTSPTDVQHNADTLVRLHFLQGWFGLSDQTMADMLLCIPLYRSFARVEGVLRPLPDAADIRRFRERVTHTALGPALRRQLQQLVPPHLHATGIETAPEMALVAWAVSLEPQAGDHQGCSA